jgi:hypothetical protein
MAEEIRVSRATKGSSWRRDIKMEFVWGERKEVGWWRRGLFVLERKSVTYTWVDKTTSRSKPQSMREIGCRNFRATISSARE